MFLPYFKYSVTSVGGSFGSEGGTEVLSIGEPAGNHPQGLNVVSGGGFSKIFSVANGFDLSYQAAAVKSWRQQPNATLSLPGYENADGSVGAGFPDVSAKSGEFFGYEIIVFSLFKRYDISYDRTATCNLLCIVNHTSTIITITTTSYCYYDYYILLHTITTAHCTPHNLDADNIEIFLGLFPIPISGTRYDIISWRRLTN
jgi:hypothetical protein